jgi:hypothetical protein
VGTSAQLGGYASARDGAPIGFTTLELRYHSRSENASLPYFQLGSGGGVAWTPDVRHLALPLQLEIGMERRFGTTRGRVGVRERFLGLVGTRGGEIAAFNSVQLIFGITTEDEF